MRVKKQVRKQATLLCMSHHVCLYENKMVEHIGVTGYCVANWNKIPQSNAWTFLQEMYEDGLIGREMTKNGRGNIVRYYMTEPGREYLETHRPECIESHRAITQWARRKMFRHLPK